MQGKYFEKRNDDELRRQVLGLHRAPEPLKQVLFATEERNRLAVILGNLDEDLSDEKILLRKIDAINPWVADAWRVEIKETLRRQNSGSTVK